MATAATVTKETEKICARGPAKLYWAGKVKESYVRTWAFRNKEISEIIFFDTTGILYKSDRGWLEEYHPDAKFSRHSDIEGINLRGFDKIPHKRKVDFNLTQPFTMRSESYNQRPSIILYIPAETVQLKDAGEVVHLETDTATNYLGMYQVTLEIIGEEKPREIYITKPYFTKTIPTEFGKEVRRVCNMLENDEIKIDGYQLEKLVKKFIIEPRK